jgi:16S rRNA G966 N2-methylase RsmD
MTETSMLIDQTVQALVQLGYSVDSQTWISKSRKGRVNVFGWGMGSLGNIVPLVAVEVINGLSPEKIDQALQQLSSAKAMMGTQSSYLFDGKTWWKASEDFRSISESAHPNPIKNSLKIIKDPSVIGPVIKPQIMSAIEVAPRQLSIQEGIISAIQKVLDQAIDHGDAIALTNSASMHYDRKAFVKALQQILVQVSGRDAVYVTPPDVIEFLFNLVGRVTKINAFYDPFAGSGSTVREAWIRYGLHSKDKVEIFGREINNSVVELANLLNSTSKSPVMMELGDSYRSPKLMADLVITAPPLGVRLSEPVETPFGVTKNGDIAAIALAVTSLNPNGVAAIITPPGWTWSKEGQGLRDWLSQNCHVVALLGLPPVLNNVTSVSPVVLVVQNSSPGETVVGSLKEDWLIQSSDDQELISAVNKLMRGVSA